MINRTAESALKRLASQFPVVGITGPRQSGKSTLAKMTFPEKLSFFCAACQKSLFAALKRWNATRRMLHSDAFVRPKENPDGFLLEIFPFAICGTSKSHKQMGRQKAPQHFYYTAVICASQELQCAF